MKLLPESEPELTFFRLQHPEQEDLYNWMITEVDNLYPGQSDWHNDETVVEYLQEWLSPANNCLLEQHVTYQFFKIYDGTTEIHIYLMGMFVFSAGADTDLAQGIIKICQQC